VIGVVFASWNGTYLFCTLFTLPISLVRGVWLLIGQGGPYAEKLKGLLPALIFLIPFVNAFPLYFMCQVTFSDKAAKRSLLLFWWLPSLTLFGFREQADKTYYFCIFVSLYLGSFAVFLWYEHKCLPPHLWQFLQNFDWSVWWCAMHAEFCLSNVIITDVLRLLLNTNQEHVYDNSSTIGRESDDGNIASDLPLLVPSAEGESQNLSLEIAQLKHKLEAKEEEKINIFAELQTAIDATQRVQKEKSAAEAIGEERMARLQSKLEATEKEKQQILEVAERIQKEKRAAEAIGEERMARLQSKLEATKQEKRQIFEELQRAKQYQNVLADT